MNTVDLFFDLPPGERATHYRELADEMRSRACGSTFQEIRTGYLKMAMEWLDMAEKLEAESAKVSVTVEAPELAAMLRRAPT